MHHDIQSQIDEFYSFHPRNFPYLQKFAFLQRYDNKRNLTLQDLEIVLNDDAQFSGTSLRISLIEVKKLKFTQPFAFVTVGNIEILPSPAKWEFEGRITVHDAEQENVFFCVCNNLSTSVG